MNTNNIQLLDEVEQNMVIYQWQAGRQRQIIDLRATGKSRYFAIAEFNIIVLSFTVQYSKFLWVASIIKNTRTVKQEKSIIQFYLHDVLNITQTS